MDTVDNNVANNEIAMIKIGKPNVADTVEKVAIRSCDIGGAAGNLFYPPYGNFDQRLSLNVLLGKSEPSLRNKSV